MSQTTKDLAELVDQLPEAQQKQILHYAQAEAAKLQREVLSTGSFLEAVQSLGIVGIAKQLPPDLSTNPAHMEGFGK